MVVSLLSSHAQPPGLLRYPSAHPRPNPRFRCRSCPWDLVIWTSERMNGWPEHVNVAANGSGPSQWKPPQSTLLAFSIVCPSYRVLVVTEHVVTCSNSNTHSTHMYTPFSKLYTTWFEVRCVFDLRCQPTSQCPQPKCELHCGVPSDWSLVAVCRLEERNSRYPHGMVVSQW